MKISLGICLKNEEAFVIKALNSIIESARLLDFKYQWSLFICLNGSDDQSEILVKHWIKNNQDFYVELLTLTEGNLIEAQRLVIDRAKIKQCSLFAFFDADIIIDKNCLPEMVKKIENNYSAQAVYAVSKPLLRKKKTILEKVMNQYDTSPTIFSPRKHLHGRCFIIKNWEMPKTDPLLIVDDIYLSFSLLVKYGVNSIQKCEQAIIYFEQIRTFKDYYRVFRRRTLELKKCFKLFPEFKKLPAEQVNKQIIWSNFFKENYKRKVYWIYFISLKKIASLFLRIDLFINPVTRPQWEPSKTSKRSRVTPYLILIEGLDCSGKKTLARTILSDLAEKGISCQVNLGPLGPLWYKKLSSFCSLHAVPDIFRSFIYTLEPIISYSKLDRFSSDVVLQVSSPLRSQSYAETRKKYFRMFISVITNHKIPKYDQIWFLTTSYQTRIARHKNQSAAGENPDKIEDRFFSEEIFNAMDNKLEFLLNKHKKINKKFNTDLVSIKDIKSQIIAEILKNI